jgi:serine/threonine protein kinase
LSSIAIIHDGKPLNIERGKLDADTWHASLMYSKNCCSFPEANRRVSSATPLMSSSNVVGVHYRVGKKIGEGSFGVIFEGTNLLNNQQVAIKFVSSFFLFISFSFFFSLFFGRVASDH